MTDDIENTDFDSLQAEIDKQLEEGEQLINQNKNKPKMGGGSQTPPSTNTNESEGNQESEAEQETQEPEIAYEYDNNEVIIKLMVDNHISTTLNKNYSMFPDKDLKTDLQFENDINKVNLNKAIETYYNKDHNKQIQVEYFNKSLFVKGDNFLLADNRLYIDILELKNISNITEIFDYIFYRQLIIFYKKLFMPFTLKYEIKDNQYNDLILFLYFMEKSNDIKEISYLIDTKDCKIEKKSRNLDCSKYRNDKRYDFHLIKSPIEIQWSKQQNDFIRNYLSENQFLTLIKQRVNKLKSKYNIT